jgi:hypothetical protein
MISFTSSGSFAKTEAFLKAMSRGDILRTLESYGQQGVSALASATPVDSGETANSWAYNVSRTGNTYTISWTNSHVDADGVPIAILLQYGHGTGTGGWIQGRDYINPAIKPIFDQIAESVWKAVTSA